MLHWVHRAFGQQLCFFCVVTRASFYRVPGLCSRHTVVALQTLGCVCQTVFTCVLVTRVDTTFLARFWAFFVWGPKRWCQVRRPVRGAQFLSSRGVADVLHVDTGRLFLQCCTVPFRTALLAAFARCVVLCTCLVVLCV